MASRAPAIPQAASPRNDNGTASAGGAAPTPEPSPTGSPGVALSRDSTTAVDDGLPASIEDELVGHETIVGMVAGTNAYVAVSIKEGIVRAYVCDGETIGSWTTGTVAGSAIEATTPRAQRLPRRRRQIR